MWKNKKIIEFKKDMEKLEDSIARLSRIIKYAKDEPSYFITKVDGICYPKIILYLYIDREEYIVTLEPKVAGVMIDKQTCTLEVKNNIACFSFKTESGHYQYEYVIDYKKGNFIQSITELESRE